MPLKINSTGGGSVTLDSGSTPNNVTITLPGTAGTMATLASVTNNGVVYVNSSGQPTSGSALTFDGTTLTTGPIQLNATSAIQFYDSAYSIKASTGLEITSLDFTRFILGSSEQMRLTSTGLGIGTSSPSRKLDVATTAADNFVKVNTTGAYNSGIEFANSGVVYGQIYFNNVSPYNLSILQQYSTGSLVFGTNNTERMRLDSSGNLGLGVTPSAWGGGFKTLQVENAAFGSYNGAFAYVSQNNYADKYIASSTATKYQQNAGQHTWFTAPSGTAGNAITFTQAMTLDANGNLLVGTTSALINTARLQTLVPTGWYARGTKVTTNGDYAEVMYNATGGSVGSIAINAASTAFNTSSDYRLKENIQPMQNALGVVAQLNPVTYTWKADGSDGQGFIAHELQAVVPDCVTGEKDAVDEDGKPVYQGVDTSFLVATLTKAIQELKAELDSAKTEINALKAKVQA